MNKLKLFILLFFITNPALANIDKAQNFTEQVTSDIYQIVTQDLKVTEIRKELVKYVKANLDIPWTAKFVLGKNWRKASAKQRERFIKIFTDYMAYSYAPRFSGYDNEQFTIDKTLEIAPQKYVSKITLILSDGTPVAIELFLLEKSENFKVVDISGEGISFAATQRAEFASIISSKGLAKFLDQLEEKTLSLKNNSELDL